MTRDQNALLYAAAGVALLQSLALVLALLEPEKLALCVAAGLAGLLLWAAAEGLGGRTATALARRRFAVAGAASLLALPVAVMAANAVGLVEASGDMLGPLVVGISSGLVLAAFSNRVPKRRLRDQPDLKAVARRQAILRYTGRTFVAAGLAYALIWVFAPLDVAALWSMVPVAAGLAMVAIRILRERSHEEHPLP